MYNNDLQSKMQGTTTIYIVHCKYNNDLHCKLQVTTLIYNVKCKVQQLFTYQNARYNNDLQCKMQGTTRGQQTKPPLIRDSYDEDAVEDRETEEVPEPPRPPTSERPLVSPSPQSVDSVRRKGKDAQSLNPYHGVHQYLLT